MYGTAAMLDGMLDRVEEELGYSATVVATGDSAPEILRWCKRSILYNADLLLQGLYLIYKKNTEGRGRRF